jgi:hypothetical protein
MLLFKNFNHEGIRTGNHLFQYASILGLAYRYGHEIKLPKYPYANYFKWFPEILNEKENITHTIDFPNINIVEDSSFYDILSDKNATININWLWGQSHKNWEDNEQKVKDALSFSPEKILEIMDGWEKILLAKPIAMSVRRGDYVGHNMFYQLSKKYYLNCIKKLRDILGNNPIIVFSDDINWCKKEFKDVENIYFSTNKTFVGKNHFDDPYQQLILMSLCSHHIISNSTFSWWGAYLGKDKEQIVIRPSRHLTNEKDFNINLYYPQNWLIQET